MSKNKLVFLKKKLALTLVTSIVLPAASWATQTLENLSQDLITLTCRHLTTKETYDGSNL